MSQPDDLTESDVNEVLVALALRFDGYKYVETRGGDKSLSCWSEQYVRTLKMSSHPNKNHAIFFILQRFLYKWGGETLSNESRHQLAFRLLFLHLYRDPVPPKYAANWSTPEPGTLDPAHVERVAAHVRTQIIARTLQHGNPLHPSFGPGEQDETDE